MQYTITKERLSAGVVLSGIILLIYCIYTILNVVLFDAQAQSFILAWFILIGLIFASILWKATPKIIEYTWNKDRIILSYAGRKEEIFLTDIAVVETNLEVESSNIVSLHPAGDTIYAGIYKKLDDNKEVPVTIRLILNSTKIQHIQVPRRSIQEAISLLDSQLSVNIDKNPEIVKHIQFRKKSVENAEALRRGPFFQIIAISSVSVATLMAAPEIIEGNNTAMIFINLCWALIAFSFFWKMKNRRK